MSEEMKLLMAYFEAEGYQVFTILDQVKGKDGQLGTLETSYKLIKKETT